MGPHGTWFDFIPGIEAWKRQAKEQLGREWTWQVFQATYFEITHVLMAALVVLLLALGALGYRRSVQKLGDAAILPDRRSSACGRCSRGWPTWCSACWRA